MNTPEEFKKTTTVTVGLVIWIATISFSMGILYARIVDHTKDIEKAREYTEQEVSGLRADWERRNAEVEKRLDRLE